MNLKNNYKLASKVYLILSVITTAIAILDLIFDVDVYTISHLIWSIYFIVQYNVYKDKSNTNTKRWYED